MFHFSFEILHAPSQNRCQSLNPSPSSLFMGRMEVFKNGFTWKVFKIGLIWSRRRKKVALKMGMDL